MKLLESMAKKLKNGAYFNFFFKRVFGSNPYHKYYIRGTNYYVKFLLGFVEANKCVVSLNYSCLIDFFLQIDSTNYLKFLADYEYHSSWSEEYFLSTQNM